MNLDAAILQQRGLDLLEQAERSPRLAAERVAAAEAHLRLVVLESRSRSQQDPQRDRARRMIDRARALDPYRAEAYLLHGIELLRAGAPDAAVEALDHAVMLGDTGPSAVRARFHRGYALLDAARAAQSTDLADGARDDFEAVLVAQPDDKAAKLGLVEATIHGKAKKLRESIREAFARVTPEPALVRWVTRLLYQAVFAFGVGKAKNIDAQNKKTMAEIIEVARAWLPVARGDRLLGGVIAAATAKCDTAEELCERLPAYTRDIPDARIVRLLLRERLAEIVDPQKRLELFASAMERIPPLDGIAQDYLQLQHLVAKRKLAEGDAHGARASWEACLEKDGDNPSTIENLLRLAEHEGRTKDADALREKLIELWTIYADLSPRADLVLKRASARQSAAIDKGIATIYERYQRESKGATIAEIDELAVKLVRADTLGRLGVDATLRSHAGPVIVRRLVDERTSALGVFETCLDLLGKPLPEQPPIAYAFYDVAKDVPEDVLTQARDKQRDRWAESAANPENKGRLADLFNALRDRAEVETNMLFDASRRAEYDRNTSPVETAELYRRHFTSVLELVKLARDVSEDDVPARVALAGRLHRLRSPIVTEYLRAGERDTAWLDRALQDVAYGGLLKKGYESMNEGKPEISVDMCRPYLEVAPTYFRLQRLFARSVLEDSRVPIAQAVELCRRHARQALGGAQPSDPSEIVAEVESLASETPEQLAQRAAAERSRNCLARGGTQAALIILWEAHPQTRGPMATNAYPVGIAWTNASPAGRGLYAWCVAQALRGNTIDWYNAQRPSSAWELGNMKISALKVARVAETWVKYAHAATNDETLPPAFKAQIHEALNNLQAALERDRKNLSG